MSGPFMNPLFGGTDDKMTMIRQDPDLNPHVNFFFDIECRGELSASLPLTVDGADQQVGYNTTTFSNNFYFNTLFNAYTVQIPKGYTVEIYSHPEFKREKKTLVGDLDRWGGMKCHYLNSEDDYNEAGPISFIAYKTKY